MAFLYADFSTGHFRVVTVVDQLLGWCSVCREWNEMRQIVVLSPNVHRATSSTRSQVKHEQPRSSMAATKVLTHVIPLVVTRASSAFSPPTTMFKRKPRPPAATHPYLAGNFAPVLGEYVMHPCEIVHGAVPHEFKGGQYIRNGGNPVHPPESGRHYHWWVCDYCVDARC
jgi:hypothetical protein